MHLILGLIFGGFIVAGLLTVVRGLRLTAALRQSPPPAPRTVGEEVAVARQKSLPVLMYVIAVPMIVFGLAGLLTILTIAGE